MWANSNNPLHNHSQRPLSQRITPLMALPQPLADDQSHTEQDESARVHRIARNQAHSQRGGRRKAHARSNIIENGNQVYGAHRRGFGGRLTANMDGTRLSQSPTGVLSATAPDFIPEQQDDVLPPIMPTYPPSEPAVPSKQSAPQRRRKISIHKSSAPDIATRTHEDINNGFYECPICTSEIGRQAKVWSCKTCWTVFHLNCVRKWSQNEGSTFARQPQVDGAASLSRQWRCPGCNLPKDTLPSLYLCWCEKESDPRPIAGLPPHSCGQTCAKTRISPANCPHPCDLICHAGPCPPCGHMGPPQICYCGKQESTRRCVETNYDTGWSCGAVCDDPMPCGEHTCRRPCHPGLCGGCDVTEEARCYCGASSQEMACCDRKEMKTCQREQLDPDDHAFIDKWEGVFDCGNLCCRPFDCGKHICEQPCHPQSIEVPHCPRSTDVISHCVCGKTPLSELCSSSRQSCLDPIPTCNRVCSKQLACGHTCEQTCHEDQCLPCTKKTSISCRCGRTVVSTVCHQGLEERPLCRRVCKATLNCGRHECGEHCCPGERKAVERIASKRRLRPLMASSNVEDGFEAEHICFRPCERLLKCGNHTCQELCHKGPCGTCREAIFDEISCNCGRTTLQPPLPCGTLSPVCRYPCPRGRPCGHPPVAHACHGDGEHCPKCPFLLEKPCMCGKKRLKNQPCFLEDVRCGEVCGKPLRCGSHLCRKTCHRPGDCEDAGRSCTQLCGKAKKKCGHACTDTCHAPSTCREDKQCQSRLLITCDCQNLKTETNCLATRSSDGNLYKSLKCDDECAKLERNRNLALALNINVDVQKDEHIPYSNETLRLFQNNVKWAQELEKEIRIFAADENERRLRCKPMPKPQRQFLHSLATDFGLDSESVDPEPHRHVFIFKTPRFVKEPMKTVQDCLRIRLAIKAANVSSVVSDSHESQQTLNGSNTPYNGFILFSPRFGLTIDELHNAFIPVVSNNSTITLDISFLPTEEVVLRARPASSTTTIQAQALESLLRPLKSSLWATIQSKDLGSSLSLCSLDSSWNIVRQESDPLSVGGWSQVAAKAASGARRVPKQATFGTKSSYVVLRSRPEPNLAKKKKEDKDNKRQKESVADDWEEEMRREEEFDDRLKRSSEQDSEQHDIDTNQMREGTASSDENSHDLSLDM